MRIDLPACDFKNCYYQLDGNCTSACEHSNCEYRYLIEQHKEWIPCSVKKHPDKSMYCHVTVIDDGDYIVGNDDWDADSESWNEYSDDEIIAWMPEITPYQEAKGNECRDILEG